LHIEDADGATLNFLTATFDSSTGNITITIDETTATRGLYSL